MRDKTDKHPPLQGNGCDFASLPEIPAMYAHCRATEDKDMTTFDFITDHLIDFDCLFDVHENDEQKPHCPMQLKHSIQHQNFVFSNFVLENIQPKIIQKINFPINFQFHTTDFETRILRPPIC